MNRRPDGLLDAAWLSQFDRIRAGRDADLHEFVDGLRRVEAARCASRRADSDVVIEFRGDADGADAVGMALQLPNPSGKRRLWYQVQSAEPSDALGALDGGWWDCKVLRLGGRLPVMILDAELRKAEQV